MGTNYYLKKEKCEHCGRGDPDLHIGKSSAGWVFLMHVCEVNPDGVNIDDLQGWQDLWNRPDTAIENEYGDIITPKEMIKIITERSWPRDRTKYYGYKSWQDMLTENYAEEGPNGLLIPVLDPVRCVAHGPGTMAWMRGEFS